MVDSVGGLQVKSQDQWIDAQVIPGTILYVVPPRTLVFDFTSPVESELPSPRNVPQVFVLQSVSEYLTSNKLTLLA